MMILWWTCFLYTSLNIKAERLTLKIYENYHSASLTYYNIPSDVESLSFYFIPFANKNKCPHKFIDIYVQYGKYPSIYQNLSSSQYVIQDQQRYHIRMKTHLTNYESLPLTIRYPNSGVWFIIAYIPKEIIKIKQKGLSSNCIYLLNISHAWNKYIVTELLPKCAAQNILLNNSLDIYKFYVPNMTWNFKLIISLLTNETIKDNQYDKSYYELEINLSDHLLYEKSDANETISIRKINCTLWYKPDEISNLSNCVIQESFPKTDTYYYVMLKHFHHNNLTDGNGTRVQYDIIYKIETCQNRAIFEDHEYHPLLDINARDAGDQSNSISRDFYDLTDAINQTIYNSSSYRNTNIQGKRALNTSLDRVAYPGNNHENQCPAVIIPLEKTHMKQHFTDSFVLKYGYMELDTLSLTQEPLLITFALEDYVDNGGTLMVEIKTELVNPEGELDIVLVGCLANRQIPYINLQNGSVSNGSQIEVECAPSQLSYPIITLSKSRTLDGEGKRRPGNGINFIMPKRPVPSLHDYDRLIVPYPLTGQWYLYLTPHCYKSKVDGSYGDRNTSGIEGAKIIDCPEDVALLTFKVRTEPCITNYEGAFQEKDFEDDKKSVGSSRTFLNPKICGGKMRGRCHISTQRKLLITGCQCIAGWEGIACDDGKRAVPRKRQMLYVALLTTSNLMFIPVVLLALSLDLYSESAIYFLNMMASIFYHACDEAVFKYCMFPYESLQYMDFYSSVLSMVVTVNAISALSPKLHSLLNVISAAVVAFLVQINRLDVWTFLGPLILSGLIMLTSWIWKSFVTRSLYPPKQVILKRLLPGICLAFVGLLIYLYAQTEDNYAYIHSLWHLIMATSILILLSEKKLDSKVAQSLHEIPAYDCTDEPLSVPVPA